jgi:hypothetical protein
MEHEPGLFTRWNVGQAAGMLGVYLFLRSRGRRLEHKLGWY